jgi:hypothetical protein
LERKGLGNDLQESQRRDAWRAPSHPNRPTEPGIFEPAVLRGKPRVALVDAAFALSSKLDDPRLDDLATGAAALQPRSCTGDGSGRYLSVISVSGCETMVMNQTALKNSDQNVSQ